MERYTYFEDGKWRLRVGDTEYSGPWVDRLAAYEDTGLEPEEVDQICRAAKTMMFSSVADFVRHSISNFDALQTYRALGTAEELSALVKAGDEGLVVVLQGDYTEADGEEALRTAMYRCGAANNPVTRYTADAIAEKLVRAEAEAAIGGGGDG